MTYFFKTILMSFATMAHSAPSNVLSDLSPLAWQNRIVIANLVENPKQVAEQFKRNADEVNDRVIVWFIIQPQQVLTNYTGTVADTFVNQIQNQYQLEQGEVVLIGKDGGVKSSRNHLDLKATFGEIDAMPMRIQEMRRD